MPEGSGGGKNAPTETSGLVQMEMQFIINKHPAIEPYHFFNAKYFISSTSAPL
jgi:hypothetical protein